MHKKHTLLFLLVFLSICFQACKEEVVSPAENLSDVPSGIIVKEKDSSGAYQIICEMKLYKSDDRIYFDSIQYTKPIRVIDNFYNVSQYYNIPTLIFDYTYLESKRFIHINGILEIKDGGTVSIRPTSADEFAFSTAIKFDNNNKIERIGDYTFLYDEFHICMVNVLYSYNNSLFASLYPDRVSDGNSGYCGCYDNHISSYGQYFSKDGSMDSAQVYIPKYAVCQLSGPQEYDTIIVSYTPTQNKTGLAQLSIPHKTRTNEVFLSPLLEYVPLTQTENKLVDQIYFPKTGFTYKFQYTFDALQRVTSAEIYNIQVSAEQRIEIIY